jgi:hypothetical protein
MSKVGKIKENAFIFVRFFKMVRLWKEGIDIGSVKKRKKC